MKKFGMIHVLLPVWLCACMSNMANATTAADHS